MVNTIWPQTNAEMLAVDEVTIAVQINGKRRDEITVPKNADRAMLENKVLELDGIKRALEGKLVKKIIVVPDRIVNIVCVDA